MRGAASPGPFFTGGLTFRGIRVNTSRSDWKARLRLAAARVRERAGWGGCLEAGLRGDAMPPAWPSQVYRLIRARGAGLVEDEILIELAIAVRLARRYHDHIPVPELLRATDDFITNRHLAERRRAEAGKCLDGSATAVISKAAADAPSAAVRLPEL